MKMEVPRGEGRLRREARDHSSGVLLVVMVGYWELREMMGLRV